MANTLKFGNGEWYGKKDTILAYNDENSNYKPLPFDFTRASNATVVNKDGLIETVGSGEPRIDYKDNTKGALLLEPSRTNLFPYSEDYSVSNWSKYGAGTGVAPTLTSNYAISPDGTLNASRLQFDKGTGNTSGDMSILNDNVIVSSGATTSKSVYVKSNTSEEYDIVVYEAVDASGTNIKKVRVTSEWQRVEVYGTVPSTTSGITIGLREINVAGLSNNADLLIYGAQVEEGSYPTSYIPTNGESGAVTRLAETCSQTPPDGVIGQTEGVAYVEVDWKGNDEESIFGVLHNGTSYRMDFGYSATFNSFYFNVRNGGGQGLMQYANPTIGKYKIAVVYKNNDFALWVNGINEASDNSGTVPITTTYNVGNYIGGGREYPIINSKLYNTRLSNSELQALTTI